MSEIGGIANTTTNPFASSAQREQGESLVEQQRQALERARESQALSSGGSGDREREALRSDAGPGIRREALARFGNPPSLRNTSDETAEIESAGQRAQNAEGPKRANAPSPDEVRLSREAQQRLAAEQSAPVAGEAPGPQTDDPLTLDTAQERQNAEFADPVDLGRNESQAGRVLGQILDQFS